MSGQILLKSAEMSSRKSYWRQRTTELINELSDLISTQDGYNRHRWVNKIVLSFLFIRTDIN